jgi:hypothetical protein
MKKTERKIGLFKTKNAALREAKARRKTANNDITPNFTRFYRVERTKKPKNPKKPGYYVIQTSRPKSKSSIETARKNLRR